VVGYGGYDDDDCCLCLVVQRERAIYLCGLNVFDVLLFLSCIIVGVLWLELGMKRHPL
jgi:hypothetical protein